MNNAKDDCCTGIAAVTPVEETNRPGLAAISYRVGTHGQFLAAMLARLSSTDHPQLRAFTARGTSDLAVALIDGWATVADVLSFYTERIASEGFLRTALDPQSVALLGKLVGYQPRPGLGASTYLAYTLDANSPAILIPAGSGVQNVPAAGNQPQAYQTTDDLTASPDWNDLPVRVSEPSGLTLDVLTGSTSIYFAGTATNLKPNDRLLFDFGPAAGTPVVKPVVTVTPDLATKRTKVAFAVLTPDQAYLDAIAVVLVEIAGLVGPDPVATNARSWIVTPLLNAIGTSPTPNPPSTVGPALRVAIRQLTEETVVAEAHQDFDTAQALSELSTAAQAAFAAALKADPFGAAAGPIGSRAVTASSTGPTGAGAVAGLSGLLAPLRLPPSSQPANSAALQRSPDKAFAAGSDNGIGLLTAADPRLAAQLYSALSTADLTPDPQLRGVQAMRITAQPFGATAPLKPVISSQGTVTDHTEWPLAGLAGLTVIFDNVYEPISPSGASFTVSYTDGDNTWTSDTVTLDIGGANSQLVYLGPGGSAECALAKDNESGPFTSLSISVSGGALVRTMTVPLPPSSQYADLAFTMTDGTGASATVDVRPDGAAPSASLGTDLITANWAHGNATVGGPRTASAASTPAASTPAASAAAPRAARPMGSSTVESTIPLTITDLQASTFSTLNLDSVYPGIVPDSWVIVERPTPDAGTGPIKVRAVNTVSVAAYGLTGRVTQLTLAKPWLPSTDFTLAPVRKTSIRAQGDPLQLAETPITLDVGGDTVDLAVSVNGLRTGRWLLVAGERTDLPNASIPGAELVMLAGTQQVVDTSLPGDTVRTRLTFANSLAYSYDRTSVHVYGNVVAADQGATRGEAIGSGDATATGQSFSLSSSPLTYLPADNPAGVADTLILRVNGVQWQERDTLATAGPTDRAFTLGKATSTAGQNPTAVVTFGDGVHGARLPTGVENVTATYRTGIGTSGNVPTGAISQLTSRPLGVRAVTNPLAATGGADADPPSVARANTPLQTYALDRLVSVRDYADFSIARAGIGRASAQRLTDGVRDVVHVTVTGVDDAPLDPTDELVRSLRSSLADFGELHLPVVVAVRDLLLLVIAAEIKVLPDYSWPLVEPVLRQAVLDLLSPANRDLGQPAYASEVLSTIQAVPGVDYVDLSVFTGVPGTISLSDLNKLADQLTGPPKTVVTAALAQYQELWHDVAGCDTGSSTATAARPNVPECDTLSSIAAAAGLSVTELVALNPWLPDAQLPPLHPDDPLRLLLRRGIQPAQLAVLPPDVPDALILKEITR